MAKLVAHIRKNFKAIESIVISDHCHDELGLAVANSIAGMIAGVRQVQCMVSGKGERAGNSILEVIVMALKTRTASNYFTTVLVSEEIFPTSR